MRMDPKKNYWIVVTKTLRMIKHVVQSRFHLKTFSMGKKAGHVSIYTQCGNYKNLPPHFFISGCIPFIRSRRVKPTGLDCDRAADVENAATSWIDMSFLYGSDTETAL